MSDNDTKMTEPMSKEEMIDILKGLVFGTFDRTTAKEREALDMAIKALEQEQRWIPVSERLPEKRDWYLAVFKESDTGFQLVPRVADYIGVGENEWRIMNEDDLSSEYRDLLECIAWMPLPEPYKAESEDKG